MCGAQAEGRLDWSTCGSQECIGIQLAGQEFCLAHVNEAGRQAFLAGLHPGSELDLRGTPIGPDLLAAVLKPLKDEKPRLGVARFDWAQFHGNAGFEEVQFGGDAWFTGTGFGGVARFDGAQFSGVAVFTRANFSGDAIFGGAQFDEAVFTRAQFERVWFARAQFSGDAWFTGAKFSGDAGFHGAKFSGDAGFDWAQFSGDTGVENVHFTGAQFSGEVWFRGAQFSRNVGFKGAQFSEARALGPLEAWGQFDLNEASFSAPILIEVAARQLSLTGAIFNEAASFRLRFAEIVLDGAVFRKPSTLSFAGNAFRLSEKAFRFPEFVFRSSLKSETMKYIGLEMDNRPPRSRLLSVRRADLSNLVLGELDLSACLFQGAHNLEGLRIEAPLRFGLTPGTWLLRIGGWWIPIWRPWVRRQALAEEHHLRAYQSSFRVRNIAGRIWRTNWNPPAEGTHWVEETTGQPVQTLSEENLAALYRALRKGLEEQKNAPGAADFYYGEMEMRRHSGMSPWADRFLLWVYWLFSGYGLRASRALLAFALLVPLFAIGFWLWGLDPDHGHRVSYPIALLRTFESATSLLRPAPAGLNEIGQLLDAFLRLIGATLLGLALFSLRGRIKR